MKTHKELDKENIAAIFLRIKEIKIVTKEAASCSTCKDSVGAVMHIYLKNPRDEIIFCSRCFDFSVLAADVVEYEEIIR